MGYQEYYLDMYVPVLASHFILIIAFFILRWLNNYKDNLAVEA
jgi:hypothetical protein